MGGRPQDSEFLRPSPAREREGKGLGPAGGAEPEGRAGTSTKWKNGPWRSSGVWPAERGVAVAGGEWPGLGAERGTVWSGVIRAAIKDVEGE